MIKFQHLYFLNDTDEHVGKIMRVFSEVFTQKPLLNLDLDLFIENESRSTFEELSNKQFNLKNDHDKIIVVKNIANLKNKLEIKIKNDINMQYLDLFLQNVELVFKQKNKVKFRESLSIINNLKSQFYSKINYKSKKDMSRFEFEFLNQIEENQHKCLDDDEYLQQSDSLLMDLIKSKNELISSLQLIMDKHSQNHYYDTIQNKLYNNFIQYFIKNSILEFDIANNDLIAINYNCMLFQQTKCDTFHTIGNGNQFDPEIIQINWKMTDLILSEWTQIINQ